MPSSMMWNTSSPVPFFPEWRTPSTVSKSVATTSSPGPSPPPPPPAAAVTPPPKQIPSRILTLAGRNTRLRFAASYRPPPWPFESGWHTIARSSWPS
jgi:hypothetical protein